MLVVFNDIKFPITLSRVMDILVGNGYKTYLVGGCVRDLIMDRTPHDYDIVTQATPEQVKAIFPKTIDTGIKHGTITVIMPDGQYEVTTMRKDGNYSDNRHPDSVEFVTDIEQDLSRRDFTMNAIAAERKIGYDDDVDKVSLELIDPFNGYKDIENFTIKCVGDPTARFQEDPLRILRALRFAVRYDFNIDYDTEKAIHANIQYLNGLSAERIQSELRKMFTAAYDSCEFGFLLFDYIDVLEELIPELRHTHDFQQHNPYHIWTVQEHILYSIIELCSARDYLSEFATTAKEHWFELCMTMLLHDIAKPQCFTQDENGVGHFYGHAKASADIADTILRRLKFSNAERERIVTLIGYHDYQFEPSARCANRLIAKLGAENAQLLMIVRFADLYAHGVNYANFGEMNPLRKAQITYLYLATVVFEKRKFSLKDLTIGGFDLLSCGYTPGPVFSACLNHLLQLVIDGIIPNNRDALLQEAEHYMEESNHE